MITVENFISCSARKCLFATTSGDFNKIIMPLFAPRLGKEKIESVIQPTPNKNERFHELPQPTGNAPYHSIPGKQSERLQDSCREQA